MVNKDTLKNGIQISSKKIEKKDVQENKVIALFELTFENIQSQYSLLQNKWASLLKKENFMLETVLEFYKECIKISSDIENFISKFKELVEQSHSYISTIEKTLLNVIELKKNAMRSLNALFFHKLFEHGEQFYPMMLQNFKSNPLKNSSHKKQLWHRLSEILEKTLKSALEHLQKNMNEKDLPYFKNLMQKISTNLPDFVKQFKLYIQQLNSVNDIFLHVEGRFLRYFNQKNHPYTRWSALLCVGVVFDWGYQLNSHPHTHKGTYSPHFDQLFPLFNLYKGSSTDFPKELPFVYLKQGESIFNHQTVKNQYKGHDYLQTHALSTLDLDKCVGTELAQKASQLFSKVKPISILTIILKPINSKEYPPHMMGLAKIILSDKSVVFRVADAEQGEFEVYSIEYLSSFLEHYFYLNNYSNLFSRGVLTNIDPYFEKEFSPSANEKSIEPVEPIESVKSNTKSNVYLPRFRTNDCSNKEQSDVTQSNVTEVQHRSKTQNKKILQI